MQGEYCTRRKNIKEKKGRGRRKMLKKRSRRRKGDYKGNVVEGRVGEGGT